MATVYLPVEPQLGMTSAERAETIDANRGGTVPFGHLIPSTSTQLTEVEAISLGWLPEDPI